jgi:hypothetical protein
MSLAHGLVDHGGDYGPPWTGGQGGRRSRRSVRSWPLWGAEAHRERGKSKRG